jgi:hypothetical protein
MQIGNDDLDRVCDEVIFPALQATGLEPRRVDRHNQGDLLKSEIVQFIERGEIIVADLTNERPNVYLEVGYAMGLGKKTHLILTARSDHFPGHPTYQQHGKRIHFDLQGYDILRWDPDDFDGFRTALEQRIRRRRALLAPSATAQGASGPLHAPLDQEWQARNREAAHAGLQRVGLPGFWETVVAIQPRGDWPQQQLRRAVEASTIDTFGWPIGVSFEQEGERPRPTPGGIVTEIAINSGRHGPHYDYWNLQRSGDFYYLRSLFEDSRGKTEELFFNTRIVQVTEMLLFLARLYGQQLEVSGTTFVSIRMTHGGLAGRRFSYIGPPRFMRPNRVCSEPELETDLMTTVDELESRLVENVKELLSPVFTLFNFAEVPDPTWANIVERFVAGELA